jgi:hypothetical protein
MYFSFQQNFKELAHSFLAKEQKEVTKQKREEHY